MTENSENRDLPVPAEPVQEQLELFSLVQQQLDIERHRIESHDRRTELAREAIQASNTADERQYNYHMARLESEERAAQRKHLLAKQALAGAGIIFTVLMALLFWMLFFGSKGQTATARELLGAIGTAVGGGGVLLLLARAMRRLLNY